MPQSPKIAIVVHNPIVADARVRKEARTIAAEGFDVNLIGYGDPTQSPPTLEGVPLRIVQQVVFIPLPTIIRNRLKRFRNRLKRFRNRLKRFRNRLKRFFLIISRILFPIFFLLRLPLKRFFLIISRILFPIFFLLRLPCSVSPSILRCSRKVKLFLFNSFSKFLLNWRSLAVLPAYHHISNLLLKELEREDYSVVHAHDIIALIAATKYKKRHRSVVLVWDAHELYTELAYKDPRASAFISKIILDSSRFVDHFITINNSISSFYAYNYPLLPPALVLMNATCFDNTSYEQSASPLRKATGIHVDQKILLFQGGLARGRGIDLMLEAASNLQFPPNWSIVFMGSGPLEYAIFEKSLLLNERRSNDRPLIKHIPPAPYESLTSWTAGADLGIIPYEPTSLNHLYCTPNKLWEFPNAGIPILASSLVEMKAMINKHGTGYLMPSQFTAKDIIDSLLTVEDGDLAQKRNKCELFSRVENWQSYEPSLLNLYRSFRE